MSVAEHLSGSSADLNTSTHEGSCIALVAINLSAAVLS